MTLQKILVINRTAYRVFLISVTFLVSGWYIKISFFKDYLFESIVRYPILHQFFPDFFKSPLTAQAAYCAPAVFLFLIFQKRKICLVGYMLIVLASSLILMWHNDMYNDATFVSVFWSGLWLLWLSWNIDSPNEKLSVHAAILVQGILGMIFFAGFMGKMTPGYFNGEAIYYMFFIDREYWPFSMFLQSSQEQKQLIAQVVSWIIMGVEGFIALGPLVPFRLYAAVVPILLLGFIIMNTWMILSVVAPLIGILVAALYWQLKENKHYA